MSDTVTDTGLARIAAMFARARAEGRPAFLPYFPLGYPTLPESLDAIHALAEAGADGFEIGLPFSDPLADGPTIQAATQVALAQGVTVRAALAAIRQLRAEGVRPPMLVMGYLNPLLAYGVDRFARDCRAAGADGLIVPDLPAEEAHRVTAAGGREGLAQVLFLAPTSGDERIRLAAARATGFIYVVSLTGVTGARTELPPDLTDFLARVRRLAGDTPIVLGFGISSAAHVRQISGLVDGYIVGSALVRAAAQGVDAVRALASELRGAQEGGSC